MKRDWPPRCTGCGRFISYADMEAQRTITYTPYGGPLDLDPPADEWMHLACWERLPVNEQQLINRVAWMAPAVMRQVGGAA